MKKILLLLICLFSLFFISGNSLVKAADGSTFYFNSSGVYYKNQNSILNVTTISNYVVTKCTVYDGYKILVNTDNYTGNGATIGSYTIEFIVYFSNSVNEEPFYFNVTINVVSGLNADYIFDNNIYVYQTNKYSKQSLVSDLKYTKVLPDVELNTTVSSSDYFVGESDYTYDPGYYSYSLQYDSSAGYTGSESGNIVVVKSVIADVTDNNTSDDVTAPTLFITFAVVGFIIFFYFFLKIGRSKSKRSFY